MSTPTLSMGYTEVPVDRGWSWRRGDPGHCVGCLVHLVVLCGPISRLEPISKPQMDAACDSALERLGRLTQEMNFDEYIPCA